MKTIHAPRYDTTHMLDLHLTLIVDKLGIQYRQMYKVKQTFYGLCNVCLSVTNSYRVILENSLALTTVWVLSITVCLIVGTIVAVVVLVRTNNKMSDLL